MDPKQVSVVVVVVVVCGAVDVVNLIAVVRRRFVHCSGRISLER